MRDLGRPRLWLGVWLFGWGLCIALSLLPPLPLDGPPGSDKLGHVIAYFCLAAWAAMLFRGVRALARAGLALFLLGAMLEVLQATLTESRQGDLRDLLADTVGLLAGLAVAATPLARTLERIDPRELGGRA